MLHALLPGELLLEIYLSIGAGEYDLSLRGDESLRALSNCRISDAERIDGANDHVQVSKPEFNKTKVWRSNEILQRNLEVPEVRKFEAMLNWARHKIRTKTSSKLDAKLEFKCIMERLARDLKLYRISPQELIKVCTFFIVFYFSAFLQNYE